MIFTVEALIQWISLGQQVFARGKDAFDAVKAAAAAHGVVADTAQLDAVIVDAERRKAMAEGEARPNV